MQLARRRPELRFVLDHLGLPDVRARRLAPWERGIQELAACPNVYCKLSGLAYLGDWQRWRPSDFDPCLDVVLERFGATRVMTGSNWPVSTVAGDYDAVMDIVVDRVQTLSEAEQARILGDTCAEFFRLEAPCRTT